jgi:hypothetical protein
MSVSFLFDEILTSGEIVFKSGGGPSFWNYSGYEVYLEYA